MLKFPARKSQMKQVPFRLIAGLISLSLLAACATREIATQEMRPVVAVTQGERATAQTEETAPERTYPAVELTPALLYQLLSAEIAGQRGQVSYAMRSYLQAAESTRDPRVAERATHIALFAQNLDYATRAARFWVKVDPGSAEARQALVSLLLGQQRYDKIKEHLEALIALSPETREHAFLKVAVTLARSANAGTALEIMGSLAPVRNGDPDALYGYAYLALQLDQLDVALRAVEQVIAQRPEADRPVIMRSRILQRQGHKEAAIKYLEEAIDKSQANFPLRLALGQMLMETSHLSQAQALFAELEQEKPEDPDILMAQGFLALERLDYERAENYFKRLAERAGSEEDSLQARFYLGQLAELQGYPGKAIGWYGRITAGGFMVEAQIRWAILTARLGDIESAQQRLDLLSRKLPRQITRFQLAQGEILVDAERYAEAMALYDKALRAKPDDTNLLYARALVAENLGHFNLLERDLRRILALDPNNAEALNALGYTFADRATRLKEALGYISRAAKLEPDNAFILDSLGWVHYRLGDYEKAEKYLRKALTIRKDPEIAAHLGEVLWIKGDKTGARSVWQRSLKLNQGSKVLLEVMRRLQE